MLPPLSRSNPTTTTTISSLAAAISHLSPSLPSVHALLIKLGLHRHTFLGNRLLSAYSLLGATSAAFLAARDITTPNTFTHNALISALFRANRIAEARQLFDQMPHRDTVTYNSLISGYLSAGLTAPAFHSLRRMLALGFYPSSFTFSISASCVTSPLIAKEMHGYLIRFSSNSFNNVVGNSFIDMYSRVGLKTSARRVFQTMEDKDIVSWNSVISACGNTESLELFRLMRDSGFSPDEYTLSAVIGVCADLEELGKGEQLLAHCFEMGYLANSVVSSAVIDMYSKCGRLDGSVRLFREMVRWDSVLVNSMVSAYAWHGLVGESMELFAVSVRMGVRPTEFTFASILSSSSCFGLAEQGTQIHCWALKLGLDADIIVGNGLVDMYMKLGSVEAATSIFCAMKTKDLVCWNTMILGLAQNGRGMQALRIFREMQEMGARPDRITLIGVLSACSHEGMIDEGEKIFSSMKDKYRVRPALEHYACMVDMFGRAGMLSEAMEIIESMPSMPSASIWERLLEACVIHGNLRFAEIISEKMMELKPRSSLPYVVLARIFGTRLRWESTVRLMRTMKERGVEKVHECSWICRKNHIIVFGSDEILHFGGEATYSTLRLLTWEIENEVCVLEQQHDMFGDG